MPEDAEFVDLGHLINIVHYRALRQVVDKTNEKIHNASASQREQYYDRGYLASQLQGSFGPGFFEMMDLEDALRLSPARALRDEDEVIAHRPADWIYFFAHLPIDPRNGVLLFQSSTIKVDGVYMGVDKWGHFHDLGNIYFQDWIELRRTGMSEADATGKIVERFSRGPISEAAIIGKYATGVQSNADLAANYAGFKFYSNLTEPVAFNGQSLPPLLKRHGAYWRLNDHVRPDANFISSFIDDHWNEALNPGRLELGLREAVKRRLRDNSDRILAFYTDQDGRPQSHAYFQNLAQQLRTYQGESYGYLSISEDEATIASCCFDDVATNAAVVEANDDVDGEAQVQMRQVRVERP